MDQDLQGLPVTLRQQEEGKMSEDQVSLSLPVDSGCQECMYLVEFCDTEARNVKVGGHTP